MSVTYDRTGREAEQDGRWIFVSSYLMERSTDSVARPP
jgi:hypothetical protein